MDIQVVRRLARGEEAAFREVVERLEKPLVNFILRFVGERNTAEDVFQETFVRVLRKIGDFEPKASFDTWVYTIARNLCLDRLKAKKRRREVSLDAPQGSPEGRVIDFRDMLRERGAGPDARAASRENEERVMRCLGTLTPAKREALVLRMFVGLSYEEVAKVVGSPIGTVKFRVHEAVRDLTNRLGAAASDQAETA